MVSIERKQDQGAEVPTTAELTAKTADREHSLENRQQDQTTAREIERGSNQKKEFPSKKRDEEE